MEMSKTPSCASSCWALGLVSLGRVDSALASVGCGCGLACRSVAAREWRRNLGSRTRGG